MERPEHQEREPLRELRDDDEVESLLEALKRDFPHSIHVHNRIATQLRWRRQDGQGGAPDVAIYRSVDEGNANAGPATAVSVWRVPRLAEVIVAVHSTDPDRSALRRALLHTKHIPWEEPINFESVHERCLPDVLDAARAHSNQPLKLNRTHKMFLPKEEALNLDVSSSAAGLVMRPLEPKHARAVDNSWAYSVPGTEEMFKTNIMRNPAMSWGLFREEDPEGEPVAFVLATWYGGLGLLYTADSHRRRGLGELVTRVASRGLAANQGLDVHCNIVYPNPASAATLAKVGFKRICECVWVHYLPPSTTSQGTQQSQE